MTRTLFALLILAVLGIVIAAEGLLQYKMEPGKSYTYVTTQAGRTTQEMMGQEMVTDTKTNAKIVLDVKAVADNGDLTCEAYYAELKVEVHSARMDTVLEMTDILNKKVQVVMSKLGEPLNVTVLDSFPRNLMMRGMGDPKMNFRRVVGSLPDQPIQIGGSWQDVKPDTSEAMGGKIIIIPNADYKVVAEQDTLGFKCLKITFTNDFAITGNGNMMGNEIFMEGEGKSEGYILFAPKEGLMIASHNKQDQDMTIAVSGSMSMTIPQNTFMKTNLVLAQ